MVEEQSESSRRRLVIVGSGIAGLTAAIYAARSNHVPLVLEGPEPGGQLTLTTDVANYPGFPEGIGGPELLDRMREQAERFGAEIEHGLIEDLDDSSRPFEITLAGGGRYSADSVILASGASARTLGIEGEDELMGYGVSTCATCDGAFFRDQELLVVGGGDAAMEEATFLTKFASRVRIVHRREEFRAEDYWLDRVREKVEAGEIEVLRNTELTGIVGTPEDGLDHASAVRHPEGHPTEKLEDPDTEELDLDAAGVFLAIGHTPNTGYLDGTAVKTDPTGYVEIAGGVGGGRTATAAEGLFAAGDVVDAHYQQAITAGGMGAQAALDADDYLDRAGENRIAAPADD